MKSTAVTLGFYIKLLVLLRILQNSTLLIISVNEWYSRFCWRLHKLSVHGIQIVWLSLVWHTFTQSFVRDLRPFDRGTKLISTAWSLMVPITLASLCGLNRSTTTQKLVWFCVIIVLSMYRPSTHTLQN